VEVRKFQREKAEAEVAKLSNLIKNPAEDSALIQADYTRVQTAMNRLDPADQVAIDAVRRDLQALHVRQSAHDMRQRAPGELAAKQAELAQMQQRRLKSFINPNDPDSAAFRVSENRMRQLGSASQFAWTGMELASKKYVKAVFKGGTASGLDQALTAVLACSVIVSNVHSQSARGKDIEVSFGAVNVLAQLEFVHIYNKVLGKAWDFQKDDALLTVGGGGESVHRLRWPARGTFMGAASLAETATMYAFAATVLAFVDLGAVAMGFVSWETYKKMLNQVISLINREAMQLKKADASLQAERKKAETAAKTYKSDTAKQIEAKQKEAEKLKKEQDKKNETDRKARLAAYKNI
jgi:Skp family chaperone for outer membrane proteins